MHAHSGPKTPKEIRAAGAAAYRNHERLQLLLEQWTSCQGAWTQSDFFLQLKQKKKHRRYGCRVWLTRGELIKKFGSESVAAEIIEQKLHDPQVRKEQVRAHSDGPSTRLKRWLPSG